MNPKNRQTIEFLLKYAPANILYRTKKEILGEPIDGPEMSALQEKILMLPKVMKAFACQKENGFIGSVLHGCYFDGFDSTVELLKKNGVELSHPILLRAREMLANWNDFENDSFYKSGNAMDEHGRGGFRAVWAELLLELGEESPTSCTLSPSLFVKSFHPSQSSSSRPSSIEKIGYLLQSSS